MRENKRIEEKVKGAADGQNRNKRNKEGEKGSERKQKERLQFLRKPERKKSNGRKRKNPRRSKEFQAVARKRKGRWKGIKARREGRKYLEKKVVSLCFFFLRICC